MPSRVVVVVVVFRVLFRCCGPGAQSKVEDFHVIYVGYSWGRCITWRDTISCALGEGSEGSEGKKRATAEASNLVGWLAVGGWRLAVGRVRASEGG